MEARPFVAEALLASGESSEVLSGLRNSLAIKTHDDTAERLVAVRNIEIDLVGDLRAFGSFHGASEEDHAHSQEEQRADRKTAEVEHCVDRPSNTRVAISCLEWFELRLPAALQIRRMDEESEERQNRLLDLSLSYLKLRFN
jgi:hypothetical protein